MFSFLSLRIIDIVDILLVAYLMYQIYRMIKGTVAMNIAIGIVGIYAIWLFVEVLQMQLMSAIFRQVMSLGMIALLILFQQEIRRFLLMVGSRYLSRYKQSIERIFSHDEPQATVKINTIARACEEMAHTRTGALIVMTRESDLQAVVETGVVLNAETTGPLLLNIFFKNSPLHDGAVILRKGKIYAARCILPITEKQNLPAHFGTRHRAAVGITEQTDAIALVVSEETGKISLAVQGKILYGLEGRELIQELEKNLSY
ncbi:MAG: diadenylate cyclase CdaA [Bacteroidales bacterium]